MKLLEATGDPLKLKAGPGATNPLSVPPPHPPPEAPFPFPWQWLINLGSLVGILQKLVGISQAMAVNATLDFIGSHVHLQILFQLLFLHFLASQMQRPSAFCN